MRKIGWLTATFLLAFCLNADAFALTPLAASSVAQEEDKKAEDQKEDKEEAKDEEKSEDKEEEPEPEEAKEPANPALDAVKAVAKQFDAENEEFMKNTRGKEFMKGYRAAMKEGRDEATAYLKKAGQPDRNAYAKQMSDVAAYAMAWSAANGDSKKRRAAMTYLFENHADSPAMSLVVASARFGVSPKVAEERYRKLIDENKDESVQGLAMMSLASMLARNPDKAEEVEKLYRTIVAKYADVKGRGGTIGETAKKALYEIEYLSVGKEAPEIKAEDLDGVEFKLTDYRGKVVLLDFWGNW